LTTFGYTTIHGIDEQRGTYFFVTRIRQFDRTKKQVKHRGFKTREEALEAEAKMLAEKDLTSNLTFAQVADKYSAGSLKKSILCSLLYSILQ